MKVSEEQRRELFDRIRSVLDEETATLLLEVTMPANVELATRADIQEIRAEILLRFTELDGRLSAQIAELAARMTDMDGRLSARITEVDGRLTKAITALDGRVTQGFAAVDARIGALGAELTTRLYTRVVPLIGVMIGLAAWLG